jgi:hypothetical protein
MAAIRWEERGFMGGNSEASGSQWPPAWAPAKGISPERERIVPKHGRVLAMRRATEQRLRCASPQRLYNFYRTAEVFGVSRLACRLRSRYIPAAVLDNE